VRRHQRARIVEALAEEICDRGYRAVTVADVVKRARIARRTFYDNFNSKEDCFLAAQEYAMSRALELVVEAGGEADSWPRRVEAGLAAFLGYVAEQPALARACMVEALAAGPAALKSYEESLQTFIALFRSGREASPHKERLPETLEEAIVGGIFWIVYQRLLLDEVERVPELLPELVEFALTPYLGAKAARAATPTAEGGGAGLALPS
jgi:AcrR family transcriptional regulator